MTTHPLPTKRTARLLLRPLAPSDLHGTHAMRSRREVWQYINTSPALPSLQETTDWLAARRWPHRFNFGILLAASSSADDDAAAADGPLVGIIGCPHRADEVGYAIRADYFGQGYGGEALCGFMEMYWATVPSVAQAQHGRKGVEGCEMEGMGEGGYDVVTAGTDKGNGASRKILERSGFVFEWEEKRRAEMPGVSDWTVWYRIERPTTAP